MRALAFSIVASLGLALALASPAAAQQPHQDQKKPSAAQQAQRDRMKTCNADAKAKNLSGEARKEFMSDCLSGKTAAAADQQHLTPQQDKMKSCNAQASQQKLSGDQRKQFMSSCLKG